MNYMTVVTSTNQYQFTQVKLVYFSSSTAHRLMKQTEHFTEKHARLKSMSPGFRIDTFLGLFSCQR